MLRLYFHCYFFTQVYHWTANSARGRSGVLVRLSVASLELSQVSVAKLEPKREERVRLFFEKHEHARS